MKVVTGAAGGIGRAIIDALVREGQNVLAVIHQASKIHTFTSEKVVSLQADLTKERDVQRIVNFVNTHHLSIDAVIHAAGILHLGAITELSCTTMEQELAVNIIGVHRITQALLPYLINTRGQIVFIGSDSGLAVQEPISYSMSKYTLEAYAEGLRAELPEVKVTMLTVGNTATDILTKAESRAGEKITNKLRNAQSPEVVAAVVVHALEEKRNRYTVMTHEETTEIIRTLLERAVEINASSDYLVTKEYMQAALDFAWDLFKQQ